MTTTRVYVITIIAALGGLLFGYDTAVICGADNRVADLASLTEGSVIAIDGKCLRRSLDKASKKAAICMVSAWAH